MSCAPFLAALAASFAALFLRLLRWKLFIQVYEEPHFRNLMRALVWSGAGNFFLPFRGGDLIRAAYSGLRMKNGVPFALATILVERLLDVVVVGLLFFLFFRAGGAPPQHRALVFYAAAAAVFIPLLWLIIRYNYYFKIPVRALSSIFNPQIKLRILFFAWSLISSFSDINRRVNAWSLALHTLGMWGLYLCSYYFYAAFIAAAAGEDFSLAETFALLYSHSGVGLAGQAGGLSLVVDNFPIKSLIAVYLLGPYALLLLLSVPPRRLVDYYKSRRRPAKTISLLPQINAVDRLNFLDSYFAGGSRDYFKKYLELNSEVHIIEDCSAGSEATTILCVDQSGTFYRKCAFGDAAAKLHDQINWLNSHSSRLALPPVINAGYDQAGWCFYDMPYSPLNTGFFNYIHSTPLDRSWPVLAGALKSLEANLYQPTRREPEPGRLKAYIATKVVANLKLILKNRDLENLQKYPELIINDRVYKNLPKLLGYLSPEYLLKVFSRDEYADIHGDLTVENIVCRLNASDPEDSFYLIDPNTGNLHDSPHLDYAKILQSIHGKYEFLTKAGSVSVRANRFSFLNTSSAAYNYLYEQYRQYLAAKFSFREMRSIYFHEAVHWLRLLPYKLRGDPGRALLFYAGFIVVLNEITAMFGPGDEL